MDNHLPKKHNKARKNRRSRPWWSKELTELWKNICITEKLFKVCKESRGIKSKLRNEYKCAVDKFDKEFRKRKRAYFNRKQDNLEKMQTNNPNKFWKEIKNLGPTFKHEIPTETVNDDGSLETRLDQVLERWRHDFQSLFTTKDQNIFDEEFFHEITELKSELDNHFNDENISNDEINDIMNGIITFDEVSKFIDCTKRGKAVGIDSLPNEVFQNVQAKVLLHKLFVKCFDVGVSPTCWGNAIINPIPKDRSKDQRIPLNYRGISLLSCVAKVYSGVLNTRLTLFIDKGLVDEQNGFRKKRACIDHIFVLSSVLRNRMLESKSTFACFIDFSKAFDSVNRQ